MEMPVNGILNILIVINQAAGIILIQLIVKQLIVLGMEVIALPPGVLILVILIKTVVRKIIIV